MEVVLILLGALVGVGLLLWLFDRRRTDNREKPEPETTRPQEEESECCGMHMTCERDSLLASVSNAIEYYDDEELDLYKGRDPRSYSEEEVEQFRDILLTLLPDDIAGWARSIQLRGIALPTEIRDELLLIVAEERQKRSRSHTSSSISNPT